MSGWRDSNSRPPAPKADASFLHIYLLFDLRVHDKMCVQQICVQKAGGCYFILYAIPQPHFFLRSLRDFLFQLDLGHTPYTILIEWFLASAFH